MARAQRPTRCSVGRASHGVTATEGKDDRAGARVYSDRRTPMTTPPANDPLLADLDQVVQETLAYFDGPGRTTTARVDRWHARDVLMHFIYFHDATAWGIQSVALGGPPWPVPANSDVVNDVCRHLHEHENLDDLLAQVRQAHARLMRAARQAPDLDKPCFQRSTGESMTGRQRLEVLARHWTEHVQELKEAAKGQ